MRTKIKRELEEGEIGTSSDEDERKSYFSSAAAAAAAERIVKSRNFAAQRNVEEFAMANCAALETAKADESGRIFTCKTCNRDFTSFQALGGHRASHKRLPRLIVTAIAGEEIGIIPSIRFGGGGFKSSRLHRCSICGLEFAMGQALGGHMRRHRSVAQFTAAAVLPAAMGSGSHSDCTSETTTLDRPAAAATTSGGGSSSPRTNTDRVKFDLNLTPYENHMMFSTSFN